MLSLLNMSLFVPDNTVSSIVFEILGGFKCSGRPVGFISATAGIYRSSWCRILVFNNNIHEYVVHEYQSLSVPNFECQMMIFIDHHFWNIAFRWRISRYGSADLDSACRNQTLGTHLEVIRLEWHRVILSMKIATNTDRMTPQKHKELYDLQKSMKILDT